MDRIRPGPNPSPEQVTSKPTAMAATPATALPKSPDSVERLPAASAAPGAASEATALQRGGLQAPRQTAHPSGPPTSPPPRAEGLSELAAQLNARRRVHRSYFGKEIKDPVSLQVFEALGEDGTLLRACYEEALRERAGIPLAETMANHSRLANGPYFPAEAIRVLAHGDLRLFKQAMKLLERRDPKAFEGLLVQLTAPDASAAEQMALLHFINTTFHACDGMLIDRLLDVVDNADKARRKHLLPEFMSYTIRGSMGETQAMRFDLIHGSRLDCVRLEAKLAATEPAEARSLCEQLMAATPPTSFAHLFAADRLGKAISLTPAQAEVLLDSGLEQGKATQVRIALNHLSLQQWSRRETFLQELRDKRLGAAATRLVPMLLRAGVAPIDPGVPAPAVALEAPEQVRHFFADLRRDRVWCLGVDATAHALGHDYFDRREPGYNAGIAAAWQLILNHLETPLDTVLLQRIHDTAVRGVLNAPEGQPFKQGFRSGSVQFSVVDHVSRAGLEQLKARLQAPPYKGWVKFHEGEMLFECTRQSEASCQKVAREMLQDLNGELAEAHGPDAALATIVRYCQTLEQLHLFQDGNIRTMVLVLNKLLLAHGMRPTVMDDPNAFDLLSVEELVQEVRRGQANFDALCKP
jgi:hypothetical protein